MLVSLSGLILSDFSKILQLTWKICSTDVSPNICIHHFYQDAGFCCRSDGSIIITPTCLMKDEGLPYLIEECKNNDGKWMLTLSRLIICWQCSFFPRKTYLRWWQNFIFMTLLTISSVLSVNCINVCLFFCRVEER